MLQSTSDNMCTMQIANASWHKTVYYRFCNCWNSWQKYNARQPKRPDGICCVSFKLEEIIGQCRLKMVEVLKDLFQLIVVTVNEIQERHAEFRLELLPQCSKPGQLVLPNNAVLLHKIVFLLLTRRSLDVFQLLQCSLSCHLPLRNFWLQLLIVHRSVAGASDAFTSPANHSLCTMDTNTYTTLLNKSDQLANNFKEWNLINCKLMMLNLFSTDTVSD